MQLSGHDPKVMVCLKGVFKHFETVTAVKDVSLEIGNGEILVLLGPSGCGKTTTLRLIAGFEIPDKGEITIRDKNVVNLPPRLRNIGMVFQDYALFPHLTVYENVAFGLRMRKQNKNVIDKTVKEYLSLVDLNGFDNRKPHQLSGGQQQRVALARVLAIKPDLLLLDEPLGALDKKLREKMQIELKNLIKKVGITTVIVTHDQEEALSLSDSIAVMDNGEIKQIGTPSQIYETPNNLFVANFIGSSNLFTGKVIKNLDGHSIIKTEEGLEITVKGDFQLESVLDVIIRPEDVSCFKDKEQDDDTKHQNIFPGIISSINYYGSKVTCYAMMANCKRIQVDFQNLRNKKNDLVINESTYIKLNPENLLVLK